MPASAVRLQLAHDQLGEASGVAEVLPQDIVAQESGILGAGSQDGVCQTAEQLCHLLGLFRRGCGWRPHPHLLQTESLAVRPLAQCVLLDPLLGPRALSAVNRAVLHMQDLRLVALLGAGDPLEHRAESFFRCLGRCVRPAPQVLHSAAARRCNGLPRLVRRV